MNDSNLSTERYFQQAEEQRIAATAAPIVAEPQPQRRTTTDSWAQASKWLSWFAGGAVMLCLMVIATGYFAGGGAKKKSNPIDWFLRLGGAKSDQTFERFMHDSISSNRIDWDEQFRKSPMYEFEHSQTPMLDLRQFNFQGGSSR